MKASKEFVIRGAKDALNASGGKLHLEFLGSEITLGKEDFENIYLCIKSK